MTVAYLGNVADQQGHSIGIATHHRRGQIIQRFRCPFGTDVGEGRTPFDIGAAGIGIVRFDGIHQIDHRQPERP